MKPILRLSLAALLTLSWTPALLAQTVPDTDSIGFEGGSQPLHLSTPDGTPPAGTLAINEDPLRVHSGAASLEFSYQRQVGSPQVLTAASLLTDFTALRMWAYSEQDVVWALGHEDRDGASFFASVVLPAGQWTLVDLSPGDFLPDPASQVVKLAMEPQRNGAGFYMLDYNTIVGPAGPNTIWLDELEVVRPPLAYIAGPLVLTGTDHVTITEPTLIDGDLIAYAGGRFESTASRLIIKGDPVSWGVGSELAIRAGSLRLEQEYRYQTQFWMRDHGRLVMDELLFLPGAMAGLGVLEAGVVQITDCVFYGGSFTGSILRSGSVTVRNSTGPGEFLVYDTGELIAENVDELIFWAVADAGLRASLDVPDWDNVTWSLPAAWNRNVSFTNVARLLPALIVSEGCSIWVHSGDLRVVGLLFETRNAVLNGYQNGSYHTSETFDWPVRNVRFRDVNVETWNFYALGTAEVEIHQSLFGEALAFNDGRMRISDSVCDGTGGYLGARDQSEIWLNNCQVASEIICDGDSFLGMLGGSVANRVTAAENAFVGFSGCQISGQLVELDSGVIAVR